MSETVRKMQEWRGVSLIPSKLIDEVKELIRKNAALEAERDELKARLEAMEQVQTAAQAHVNAVRYQLEIEDEPHTHRLLREALAAVQQEEG